MSDLTFTEFVERYFQGQDGVPALAPWQVEMAERIMLGAEVVAITPRSDTGWKRRASRIACALWEFNQRKWDAVASSPEEERRMRRQAREDAARISAGEYPF